MLLELLGNEVNAAHDGEHALEMANELKPDVVLLDIGLPKLNGYEVARRIRLDRGGTIRCSSPSPVGDKLKSKDMSRQAGFDHHLVKPVDPDALMNLIENSKPRP